MPDASDLEEAVWSRCGRKPGSVTTDLASVIFENTATRIMSETRRAGRAFGARWSTVIDLRRCEQLADVDIVRQYRKRPEPNGK